MVATMLARLPEVILRVSDAVAAAVGGVLGMVRVARVLVVWVIVVLVSLAVVSVFLGLPLSAVVLLLVCAGPVVVLFRVFLLL